MLLIRSGGTNSGFVALHGSRARLAAYFVTRRICLGGTMSFAVTSPS